MSGAGSKAILEIADLKVAYGAVRAVDGLHLRVEPGSIVCLIGANGAGKTSVLRAASGLAPFSGEIRFKGRPLRGVPPHRLVEWGMAHCPEGRGVLGSLDVSDNLELGAYTRKDLNAVRRDRARVLELFPRLAERLGQKAGTLSGGEQQMLAMARALMAAPELLLLDEPSLGLAPQVVETLLETVARICGEGVSVLLVEQNAAAALEIGHYAYVLENGRLSLEGRAQDVAQDERVRKAYLGA